MQQELPIRPRRLRHSKGIRNLTLETIVNCSDLIQPVFVMDGDTKPEQIASMPNISRHSIDDLVKECTELYKLGINGIALFPKIDDSLKNESASTALSEDNVYFRAIHAIKSTIPELVIFADIALDPYTSHGHDGILSANGKHIENDQTVEILSKMAVIGANAGADFVSPSDMMDGRIKAIRESLDSANHTNTGIMAYSAKFASAFYGPFRDAVGSSKQQAAPLDKNSYQLSPANRREATKELLLDQSEGADILMVKPAGMYLDIISDAKSLSNLPIAAYQVSGEYAQIHAAAEKGWLDLEKCANESLTTIKRAGADIIFSYFSKWFAQNATQ